MQNRYAGDIGDFGKFHLLRTLFNNQNNSQKFTLKQIWYLYPDESHNSDGMYINYFEKVKNSDIELEESFKKLVSKKRSVKSLEKANLISNCTYFSKYITKDGKDCLIYRKKWFYEAIDFSKESDFIFVDPDNGMATKVDKKNKEIEILGFDSFSKKSKAGKYIFFDEIKNLALNTKCLVIYHHLNRLFSHNEQVNILKNKLEKSFPKVIAIKHKPYSPRVYFFILEDEVLYQFLKSSLDDFYKEFNHHWELFI